MGRAFNTSYEQRFALFDAQGGLCALCREPMVREPKLRGEDWNLDHIIPWGQGGTSEVANAQAAHSMCNLWKGSIDNALVGCVYCQEYVAVDRWEQHERRHETIWRKLNQTRGSRKPVNPLIWWYGRTYTQREVSREMGKR